MEKRSSFRWLLALSGLVGCTASNEMREVAPVATLQQPLVVSGTLQRENLTLMSVQSFENPLKVVPPSTRALANCANGRASLVGGNTNQFASRPLIDSSGNIDLLSTPSNFPNPLPTNGTIGTDNQVVRMSDGSLLAVRGNTTWDTTVPAGPFANENVQHHSGINKGARGGILAFYRSTDCGATWSLWSQVDFGTFAGGKYGWPRPRNGADVDVDCNKQGREADSSRQWWIGGGDLEEMYACPFTGNVYVTMHILVGPFCGGPAGTPQTRFDANILLASSDGKTWQVASDTLPAAAPMVMTSTPNGRLFVLSSEGGFPMIRVSAPVGLGEKPQLGAPFSVAYKLNGVAQPVGNAASARGTMLQSDRNLGLAINAAGGARRKANSSSPAPAHPTTLTALGRIVTGCS